MRVNQLRKFLAQRAYFIMLDLIVSRFEAHVERSKIYGAEHRFFESEMCLREAMRLYPDRTDAQTYRMFDYRT